MNVCKIYKSGGGTCDVTIICHVIKAFETWHARDLRKLKQMDLLWPQGDQYRIKNLIHTYILYMCPYPILTIPAQKITGYWDRHSCIGDTKNLQNTYPPTDPPYHT